MQIFPRKKRLLIILCLLLFLQVWFCFWFIKQNAGHVYDAAIDNQQTSD